MRPNTAISVNACMGAPEKRGRVFELISPTTEMVGSAPFKSDVFAVAAGQAIKFSAYNLSADARLSMVQVYSGVDTLGNHTDAECAVACPKEPVVIAEMPHRICGKPTMITAALPILYVADSGTFRFDFSGTAFRERKVFVVAQRVNLAEVPSSFIDCCCKPVEPLPAEPSTPIFG